MKCILCQIDNKNVAVSSIKPLKLLIGDITNGQRELAHLLECYRPNTLRGFHRISVEDDQVTKMIKLKDP